MTIGITRGMNERQLQTSLQFGLGIFAFKMRGIYQVTPKFKLKASGVVSTSKISVSVGCERSLSKLNQLGLSLEAGIPVGVQLQVKSVPAFHLWADVYYVCRFVRSTQQFTVPILVSSDVSAKTLVIAGAIPLAMALFVEFVVLRPRKRRRRAEWAASFG